MRSSSNQGTVTTCSSVPPSCCSTVRWGASASLIPADSNMSPTASFTDSSTSGRSHWATSNAPEVPAASTSKQCPSTMRAPTATGSMPRRTHARSTNDRAGTSSTDTDGSASSSSTVCSATTGDPGTAYSTVPCTLACPTRWAAMVWYTSSIVSAVSYTWSKDSAPTTTDTEGCRTVRTKRTGCASMASRVATVNRSTPAGPRPTTTTVGSTRGDPGLDGWRNVTVR